MDEIRSESRGLLATCLAEGVWGSGRLGVAWRSLKCRMRGLTLLPDPAGWALAGMALGKAVGSGVSIEGCTRANPKKIPVSPSSFNGPSEESGKFAMSSCSARGQMDPRCCQTKCLPVGIPRNLAPLPKPWVTTPSKWIGYGGSGPSPPTVIGRFSLETGAISALTGGGDRVLSTEDAVSDRLGALPEVCMERPGCMADGGELTCYLLTG